MRFTDEQKAEFSKIAAERGMKRVDMDNGSGGMAMHKRSDTGAFTPPPGYYLIEEIPLFSLYADTGESLDGKHKAQSASRVELNCRDHREIKQPIYAKYNANSHESFTDEIILIEGKFLYNKYSLGPKEITHDKLELGAILHIIEAKLVNGDYEGKSYPTYSILWEYPICK